MGKINFTTKTLKLESFLTQKEIDNGDYNIFVKLKNTKGYYLYLSKETLKTTSNKIIEKIEYDMKQKIAELAFGGFTPPVNIRGYLEGNEAVLVNRVGGYFCIHDESKNGTTLSDIEEIYVFEDFPHGLNMPFIKNYVYDVDVNGTLTKRHKICATQFPKNVFKFWDSPCLPKFPHNLKVEYIVRFQKIGFIKGNGNAVTEFKKEERLLADENIDKCVKRYLSVNYKDNIVRNVSIKLSESTLYDYSVYYEVYPKLTPTKYSLQDKDGKPIASVIEVKEDCVLINLIGTSKIVKKKIKTNQREMYFNIDSSNCYKIVFENGIVLFERYYNKTGIVFVEKLD